ncbi:MAG: ArgE/DapE family deacylase [Cyclobacteriaceae bacterium]
MADSGFVIQSLQDLVRINSVNPFLEPFGKGEREIGNYIHTCLLSLGFDSKIIDLGKNQVNVVGRWRGTGNGKTLAMNAHMDTVGVEGMSEPFAARIEGNKLFGRGAYDMKGSIAAILGVAKEFAANKPSITGDLILTFVADEEYESIGTQELLKNFKADACIVTEPTDLTICLGHRGFGVYEITTFGKVAHGGLHREGVDANMMMGRVLHALDKLSLDLSKTKTNPLCGEASLHVPIIKGGQSLFIYSGECKINVERRTIPGESKDGVHAELQQILDHLSNEDSKFSASLKNLIWRNPYEVKPDSSIVKSLQRQMPTNSANDFIGHTWWEDSGLFGEAGIETVIIGPRGGGIHQAIEWVELDSVVELSRILYNTTLNFCK